VTQQFQKQIAQLSMQLSSLHTKLHEQQTLRNEQQKQLNDALLQNQLIENELSNKSAALAELRAQMIANDENHAQLLIQYERIQSDSDKILANHTSALKENEHLTKEIEGKKLNIYTLQNNYRPLIEEKSVLTGQFKQLQASL
jgi:predicted  nucleic acid-binding Zn-ribbon protein